MRSKRTKIFKFIVLILILVALILPNLLKTKTTNIGLQEKNYKGYEETVKEAISRENKKFSDDLSEELETYYSETNMGYEISKIGLHFADGNNTLYINNAIQLKALSYYVNYGGHSCAGKTIVLLNDIKISKFSEWVPIGNNAVNFEGTFDGNYKTITINIDGIPDPTYSEEIDVQEYSNSLAFSFYNFAGEGVVWENDVGIFGVNSGTIKELVVNAKTGQFDISKNKSVQTFGLIVGSNNGEVLNCYYDVKGAVATYDDTQDFIINTLIGNTKGTLVGYNASSATISILKTSKYVNLQSSNVYGNLGSGDVSIFEEEYNREDEKADVGQLIFADEERTITPSHDWYDLIYFLDDEEIKLSDFVNQSVAIDVKNSSLRVDLVVNCDKFICKKDGKWYSKSSEGTYDPDYELASRIN